MSFHAGVRLPDGRDPYVDHRHPLFRDMQKIHRRQDKPGQLSPGCEPEYERIARHLDSHPEEFCTLPFSSCSHEP